MPARRTKAAATTLPPTPLQQFIATKEAKPTEPTPLQLIMWAIEADDKQQEKKPHPRRSNAICVLCSTPFYATPRQLATGGGRYCSNACKGDAYRGKGGINWVERPPLTCAQCGKLFNRPPSKIKRGGGIYCSKACLNEANRGAVPHPAAIERRKAARPRGLKRHCLACGKQLIPQQKKYCSMACYGSMNSGANSRLYTGGKLERNCEVCGAAFKVSPAVVGYGFGRYCSMKCLGIYRSQHAENNYSRTRGGRRPDLDNRYFRSGWEANYARYLNWLISVGQIAKWEYEVDTYEFTAITRGVRTYTPDFKIHNLDGSTEYHEVKGWMDTKSKTKLDRMRRYYPAIKVIIIDEPAYKSIAKEVKHLVAGWELSQKHSA